MNNVKPLFDPATHYRIEVRGCIDLDWLHSLDSSWEFSVDETRQVENITVLEVHADQAGMVGLLRRLHGLGMTILQLQIIPKDG